MLPCLCWCSQALLAGGRWINLLPPGHPGVPEVKWCRNRFTPFLCIAPEVDTQPGERDYEEYIEVSVDTLDAGRGAAGCVHGRGSAVRGIGWIHLAKDEGQQPIPEPS